MGIYIYRITASKHVCSDGKSANIALYAYKPTYSWEGEKLNKKWHFRSGAQSSDNMAAKGALDQCRIVLGRKNDAGVIEVYPGEAIYRNAFNLGSFSDCDLGEKPFPRVENVRS